MTKPYKMRGLPCYDMVRKQEMPYYIAGAIHYEDGSVGGGVIEWCYSRIDAERLLHKMKEDPRFQDLSIGCTHEARPNGDLPNKW